MANGNAGSVSVRFSVENAETVRKALEALGKDGERALRQLDAAGKPVPKGLGLVSDAIANARGQAQTWAATLGPLGSALMAIGPIGLAVAGAIGGAVLVMARMREEATRLANDAGRMVDFGETVKLSVEQIQALRFAGSQVGVSNDKLEASLGRLSASLAEIRDRTGAAYDALRKVDPQLAREMSLAKDTAAAVDLLAQAWNRFDTEQRNALSRALFGRGGLDIGRILSQLNDAGGLAGFMVQQRQNIILTQEQAERFDQLKDKIDATRQRAKDLMASLFSEDMLQRELKHVEYMERAARAAARMAENPSWWNRFVNWFTTNDPRSRDQRPLGGPRRTPADLMPQKDAPEPTFDKRWIDRVEQPTLRAQLNTLRERNALLGEAITPSEQLKQKTLELAVATEKDATLRDAARRGLDAFILAQDRAAVAARVQLGIASDREMMAIRLRDIEEQVAKGFIRNEQEKALAMRLANKEIDEQVKALAVRRSQFPGLTKFGQEATDLRAGIDQLAVSTFNDANKALVDLQMNSGKAGEAWKRFVEQFNRGLLEMINKRFIFGPLANAASGWLNNLLPAGAGPPFTPMGPGFAFGGIFDGPHVFRFANGGAGSFGILGEAGPEAIVPLKKLPSGRLGIEAIGAGASAPITVNVINAPAGTQVRERRDPSNGGRTIDVLIDAAVANSLATPGMRGNRTLRAMGGADPIIRR